MRYNCKLLNKKHKDFAALGLTLHSKVSKDFNTFTTLITKTK